MLVLEHAATTSGSSFSRSGNYEEDLYAFEDTATTPSRDYHILNDHRGSDNERCKSDAFLESNTTLCYPPVTSHASNRLTVLSAFRDIVLSGIRGVYQNRQAQIQDASIRTQFFVPVEPTRSRKLIVRVTKRVRWTPNPIAANVER